MAITQREAFAQVMEHLVTHDGGSGHGYSQYNRMGDGTTETIRLSDGTTVTIAGGDRDCSSAVITALRAVGINTFGATYTGNMREQLLKTGLFGWRKMGVKSAQRGDIYLNEKCHTAVCISPYGSARGDLLAQFSISERGTITGTTGDQNSRESNIKAYYSYPWDGTLYWLNDGKTLSGTNTEVADNTDVDLGDVRYWGPKFTRAIQKQLGTTVDGVISGQHVANQRYFWAVDRRMDKDRQWMWLRHGARLAAQGRMRHLSCRRRCPGSTDDQRHHLQAPAMAYCQRHFCRVVRRRRMSRP